MPRPKSLMDSLSNRQRRDSHSKDRYSLKNIPKDLNNIKNNSTDVSQLYAQVNKDNKKLKSKESTADIKKSNSDINRPISADNYILSNDIKLRNLKSNNEKQNKSWNISENEKLLKQISHLQLKLNERQQILEELRKENCELKKIIYQLQNSIYKPVNEIDSIENKSILNKSVIPSENKNICKKSKKTRNWFFRLWFTKSKENKTKQNDSINNIDQISKNSKPKRINDSSFGNSLENVRKNPTTQLPEILEICIRKIENSSEFICANGLYRICGNYAIIKKLKAFIINHRYNKIEEQKDPHVIANILKLFLRELKEPLISYNFLEQKLYNWQTIDQDSDQSKLYKIKHLINELPKLNYNVLRRLIQHLKKVAEKSSYNNMPSEALSIVIGPCIFYDVSNKSNIENMHIATVPTIFVHFMIDHSEELFDTIV